MTDLFDYIEDAEAGSTVVDVKKPLTDDQLEKGGLSQVRAFVRTKASANALRVKKYREKAAESGLQQLNVTVPAEAKDVIKDLAKRASQGEDLTLLVSIPRTGFIAWLVRLLCRKQTRHTVAPIART